MSDRDLTEPDAWAAWRQFTNARIALGRSGHGLPTAPLLAFSLAHAQARDAVQHPLDIEALRAALRERGHTPVEVRSAAPDRAHYLRRPDLGRRLEEDSRARLAAWSASAAMPHAQAVVTDSLRVTQPTAAEVSPQAKAPAATDLVIVIADGLSATAANRQAVPLLDALLPRLDGWRLGPLVIATQARVALGDDIGQQLNARFVVMLIGERPGLSSPDSLGLYLTHAPRIGRRDAERNCISNVRPEGLGFEAAAHKLHHLLTQARRLGLTGVGLKDDSDRLPAPNTP